MASLLRRHSLIVLGLVLISAVAWSVSAQTPRVASCGSFKDSERRRTRPAGTWLP